MLDKTEQLSKLIIATAKAGGEAQKVLSTADQPVGLQRFEVEVKYTCSFEVASDTEITLKIWVLDVKEKIHVGWKEELSVTIKMTLIPLPKTTP